jgi:ParB family chromosome partitioning protein
MEVIQIDPKKCIRWDYANRSVFEFGDLAALARDIKINSQVEPVLVRPIQRTGFDFEIIAGARRWKACLDFELPLQAIVKNLTDLEALHHQIKENEKIPLSDYSLGMHIAKLIDVKKMIIQDIINTMHFSRAKINNLLTFAKVPIEIWETISNLTKVSSKSAEMIYRLSSKGNEYINAIKQIADEISKGAGANKIQSLVTSIVDGDLVELEHRKKIVDVNGQTIGFWTKYGINFEKGIHINQDKLEAAILTVVHG